jgi:hypothetical protein
MIKSKKLIANAFVMLAFGAGILFDGNIDRVWSGGSIVSNADAAVVVVKRKRHHHRHIRVVRRSTIYINVLPARCVVIKVNGIGYWQCGNRYYQRYNGRYVVVYIN